MKGSPRLQGGQAGWYGLLAHGKVTAGDSLTSPATPDAVAGQQRYEVTGQKAPDRVQKYRERLASVATGVKQGGMGYFLTEKALTANHIEELDDSEIERLYARTRRD